MADSTPSLTLQADLSIEHVAELQAALAPHLAAEATLVLDGSQVRRVHSAGLQLLHAFVRERAGAGHGTTVLAPPPPPGAPPPPRGRGRPPGGPPPPPPPLLALDGTLAAATPAPQTHASTTGEPA